MKIEFTAGFHISDAAKKLVEAGPGSYGEFNGIRLDASETSTADDIVAYFMATMKAQSEAYRASPEGIATAARDAAEVREAQALHDKLVADLAHLDFKDDVAVLDWICAMQPATDRCGVKVARNDILLRFADAGYRPNQNTGKKFNENDRENFHRYLVGQALDGVAKVAIHGIIHKFVADWKAKFAGRSLLKENPNG